MAATALIRLQQGLSIGTPGQVLVGDTGTLVSITNNVNTGVNSWQIDLVYTPPGSAVLAVVPAFNNASSIPAASFTPDVPGSYRLVLTVWDAVGRVGTYNQDIRNFIVPEPKHGFVVPPYQEDPNPKPSLASGHPGAKPNETNIGGSEKGWVGTGFPDGLLADFIQRVDASNFDIAPDIGSSNPGSFLGIAGSNGRIYSPSTFQVIQDSAGRVVIPSTAGSIAYWRVNSNGAGTLDVYRPPSRNFALKLFRTEFISSGSQLWGAGINGTTSDGFIQEVVSGTTLTLGTEHYISPGFAITGLDYDGTFLWAANSDGDIFKINPATPAVPVTTLSTGASILPLRIDQNAANYGGSGKRGFFLDSVAGNIYRFTLGVVPAVDLGPTAVPVNTRALAIGTGTQNGNIFAGGDQDIFRGTVAFAPGITNSFPLWLTLNSLDYDPVHNKLWATAENGLGNVVVARIHPGTLTVESFVELSHTSVNSGYGSGAPARVRFIGGSAWVGDPAFADPAQVGNVYRLDLTDGSLITSDVNGATTSGFPTFTDAGHDFTAEGVLPGDLLVLYAPDGQVFTVDTVGITTLTVTEDFGDTAAGITYDIFRPITKTLVGDPGPKTVAWQEHNWIEFVPRFENPTADAVLGDGILRAWYQKIGNSLSLRLLHVCGSTTSYGSNGFLFIPFPEDIAIDTRLAGGGSGLFPETQGVALAEAIVSTFGPLGVVIPLFLAPWFIPNIGLDLSPFVPGDTFGLKFSVPILT